MIFRGDSRAFGSITRSTIFIPLAALLLCGPPVGRIEAGQAPSFFAEEKLIARDGQVRERFGSSVSVSGDTVVVGAQHGDVIGVDAGSVHVYRYDVDRAGEWSQVAKLVAPDGQEGDAFGASVALDGDTLVVGAKYDDDLGFGAGSAYVFERDAGGPGAWGQVAKLNAKDPGFLDQFGEDVTILADTAVIGAPGQGIGIRGNFGPASGAAYVFERDLGAPGAWGLSRVLLPDDAEQGDEFGEAVALSGDTLVVGATRDDDVGHDSGSAYVFERDLGGLDAWGQIAKLTASDGTAIARFGTPVALAGDTVIVGAVVSLRTAYVFQRDSGGTDSWGQTAKLGPVDGQGVDTFGESIALAGDTLVVGTSDDDDLGASSGSAFVFREVIVDPTFEFVGDCPGAATMTVSATTPMARIQLWGGLAEGTSALPSGPCAGTELGLNRPSLLFAGWSDSTGGDLILRNLPESWCGSFVQLLDATTCATSDVVPGP